LEAPHSRLKLEAGAQWHSIYKVDLTLRGCEEIEDSGMKAFRAN